MTPCGSRPLDWWKLIYEFVFLRHTKSALGLMQSWLEACETRRSFFFFFLGKMENALTKNQEGGNVQWWFCYETRSHTLKLKRKKDWVHGNVLESFLYECSYKEKLCSEKFHWKDCLLIDHEIPIISCSLLFLVSFPSNEFETSLKNATQLDLLIHTSYLKGLWYLQIWNNRKLMESTIEK